MFVRDEREPLLTSEALRVKIASQDWLSIERPAVLTTCVAALLLSL